MRRVSLGLRRTHRAVSVLGPAALLSADLAFPAGAASADLAASLVSDNGRTCRTCMIPVDLETGTPLPPGSGLGMPLVHVIGGQRRASATSVKS